MCNPWLSVPLEDYEGHMSSPQVQQLAVLSELFGEALALCRPASVAILGIAGGNGLEHIDPQVTKRVVGVDLNPMYLDAVAQRYQRISKLELHCVDLAKDAASWDADQLVDLVHAALVFEHAGVGRCLENAVSLVARGGALSVVLQLPSETEHGVGATAFPSIQNLKDHFTFVDPVSLRGLLEQRGFCLRHETRRALASGKSFWMGVFAKE
jgi:Methyltransferase domain